MILAVLAVCVRLSASDFYPYYYSSEDGDTVATTDCCAAPYTNHACPYQTYSQENYVTSNKNYCYEVDHRCQPTCSLTTNGTGATCGTCCAPYSPDRYCVEDQLESFNGWVWWLIFWVFICPLCLWATITFYDEEADPSEQANFARSSRFTNYSTGIAPSYTAAGTYVCSLPGTTQ
jgi:hypothetical protein